jgi:pyrimidine-nucleoside phosphorylase
MMNANDLIAKKRDGGTHSDAEIAWLIDAYVAGRVPDYQMAAWLMAAYLRGLDQVETLALTMSMTASGQTIDLAGLPHPVVDKHSTGGVGDKTTLVLAPLVAACGLPVAKMSGRGLGHTGGTLDKLESIPGVRVDLSPEEFRAQVAHIGVAVVAQSAEVVPADRLLYALRDVTATVDSLPLIASSIMCKKLAAGADAIVLDVKTGGGAFMREPGAAVELARAMVEIGRGAGRRMAALVTDMDSPLGHAIGNALEVREAVDTLRGHGPDDFTTLCLELAGRMLLLGAKAITAEEGVARARRALDDGAALRVFQQLIATQGGPADFDGAGLPEAPVQVVVTAPADGYVQRVDALALGVLARDLGAGRATKSDAIDPAVGLIVHRKAGDKVRRGEALATLHAGRRDTSTIAAWEARCRDAFAIGPAAPEPRPLIHAVIV